MPHYRHHKDFREMGYTITESDILDSANTEYWFDSSVKLISSIPHSDELTGGHFFMWSSLFYSRTIYLHATRACSNVIVQTRRRHQQSWLQTLHIHMQSSDTSVAFSGKKKVILSDLNTLLPSINCQLHSWQFMNHLCRVCRNFIALGVEIILCAGFQV